jgi:hypothetical protein
VLVNRNAEFAIPIAELKPGDIVASHLVDGRLLWTTVEFFDISNGSFPFTSLDIDGGFKLEVTVDHGLLVDGMRTKQAQYVGVDELLPTSSGWRKVVRKSNSTQSTRVTVSTTSGMLLVNGVTSTTLCSAEFADGDPLDKNLADWQRRHRKKFAAVPIQHT